MKYYVIDLEANNSTIFIEEIQSNIPKVEKEFSKGEKIKCKNPSFEGIYTTELGNTADVLSVSPLIVNNKIKEIIENTKVPIESYEISLKGKINKYKKDGYFIINVLNNIDAIDFEKSILEFYPETDIISSISKLVLNSDKSTNRSIFGIKKINREIFINSELKSLLKDATGISFKNSNEYSKL